MEHLLTVWGRGVERVPTTAADRQRLVDLYDGEIAYLDHQLGPLLDDLTQGVRGENTAVILTADHGESLTEHDYLFDHGEFLYQPSVHVPFILQLPERDGVPPRSDGALVQVLDVAPTFLALAGITPSSELDGHDLGPLARREAERVRDTAFAESCRPWGVEKGFEGVYRNLYKAQLVLDGEHSLIATPFRRRLELYGLDEDPGELENLAAARPEVADRLLDQLERWREGEIELGRPDPANMKRIEALGYVE
ncbi:MAG: hypothetical protein CL908_20100 [Deltaproteobacteria bacterium]|nr:hypothetical protein [Deltaproteobacteria bacterium]